MNQAIETLKNALGEQILSITCPVDNRYFVELEGQDVHLEAVKHLTEKYNSRLITISAVDLPAYHEIMYHMDLEGHVITLKIKLWKPEMELSSVASINPAAELIEHEIMELFGIQFDGNPRPFNMLLDDETQKNFNPLRNKVGKLGARIDKNVQTIVAHGSTTAPSRRVMKARGKMDMPENPPLCSISCPAKNIVYDIANASGTISKHPNIKKKEADL